MKHRNKPTIVEPLHIFHVNVVVNLKNIDYFGILAVKYLFCGYILLAPVFPGLPSLYISDSYREYYEGHCY